MCKKLEIFKKSWNFKYVMFVTPILLLGNMYFLYKLIFNSQYGGSNTNVYNFVMGMLITGYGLSFLNDYAIVDLFTTMKKQLCPCVKQEREILENVTYGKIAINSLFLLIILKTFNLKTFNLILKKVKAQTKK